MVVSMTEGYRFFTEWCDDVRSHGKQVNIPLCECVVYTCTSVCATVPVVYDCVCVHVKLHVHVHVYTVEPL